MCINKFSGKQYKHYMQGSKKVPSGRPEQVDFCVRQVTFPTHLPDGQGYGQAARELSWNKQFIKSCLGKWNLRLACQRTGLNYSFFSSPVLKSYISSHVMHVFLIAVPYAIDMLVSAAMLNITASLLYKILCYTRVSWLQYAMLVPSAVLFAFGLVIFFCLIPSPDLIGKSTCINIIIIWLFQACQHVHC